MQTVVNHNNDLQIDSNDEVKYKMQAINELIPNHDFISLHNLRKQFHPADWLCAFLPNWKPKGAPPQQFCTGKCCTFLNARTIMDLAGISERVGS